MDNIESLCRIICQANGSNADFTCTAMGVRFPIGTTYPKWRLHENIAKAILDAGWKPPKQKKGKK